MNREMLRPLAARAVACFLLSVAVGCDGTGSDDGGEVVDNDDDDARDAGDGAEGGDGGEDRIADGGEAPADAGLPGADGGIAGADGGAPLVDGGLALDDGGPGDSAGDDAGMSLLDGGVFVDGGVLADGGTASDGGPAPGPFEPSISVSYEATQEGQILVADQRAYSGDEIASISCQIDARGLRLLMTAPTPNCGNDEFRVLVLGFGGAGTYQWPDNQTSTAGLWTAYSPPRLRAQGQTGCFDRPILPRSQTLVATEDGAGRLTIEVTQTGRSIGSNVSAGQYDTSTAFTLTFDPASCEPYDSGEPACSGVIGEDLGQGANNEHSTLCEFIPPGGICDDTDPCSTTYSACREPTNEECAGVLAGLTDETEREDACGEFARCVFVPAADGAPSRCDAAPISDDVSETCGANADWTSCNNDGCVLEDLACEGVGNVECSALPDDDLACLATYPCLP